MKPNKILYTMIILCIAVIICWSTAAYIQLTDTTVITPRQLQQQLVELGYLDPNDVPGGFGAKSHKAWEQAVMNQTIRECNRK